jgi:deoxyribonuclease-4
MNTPRLGAHVSTAGGLARAFERGRDLGCDALQIFLKSPGQWRGKPLTENDAASFRGAREAAGRPPVVAHAAYLINLCARDPELLERSRAALVDELVRAAALGLDGVVVHPGAHLGAGVEAGLEAVAQSIDAVLAAAPAGPRLLLELTAGQGSVLGSRLEQLAELRARARADERIAYCLDTCHAFAGGYDLSTAAAVERFLEEVERRLGFERIACLHLNDSVGELGSARDRHASIGAGRIGLDGFRRLLADPRLLPVPMILETPIGDDQRGHARDLETLRGLLAPPPPERLSRPRTPARTASKRRSRGR